MFRPLLESYGVQRVIELRRNMKNLLMPLADKLLLRQRAIVETIIDELKNISKIEYTRHRSMLNGLVNLVCGLNANALRRQDY